MGMRKQRNNPKNPHTPADGSIVAEVNLKAKKVSNQHGNSNNNKADENVEDFNSAFQVTRDG